MASFFNKGEKKEESQESRAKRSMVLHVACAIYLLYLVYQMVTSAVAEPPTGSELYVVIIGSAVFTIAGVVILFFAARKSVRNFRATLDAAEELEREDEAARAAMEAEDDDQEVMFFVAEDGDYEDGDYEDRDSEGV